MQSYLEKVVCNQYEEVLRHFSPCICSVSLHLNNIVSYFAEWKEMVRKENVDSTFHFFLFKSNLRGALRRKYRTIALLALANSSALSSCGYCGHLRLEEHCSVAASGTDEILIKLTKKSPII